MRISQQNTDLGGSVALFGEFADLFLYLIGGGLQPGRWVSAVGDGRGSNALAVAVHTTHIAECDEMGNKELIDRF
jgi:hypothetical protein